MVRLMIKEKDELKFMRDVVQRDKISSSDKNINISGELNIGTAVKGYIHFSKDDKLKAIAWLSSRSLDVSAPDLKNKNRIEVAKLNPQDEKLSAANVKKNRVSIKCLDANDQLLLNNANHPVTLPTGIHLDIDIHDLKKSEYYDAIIVVENYLAFVNIHTYALRYSGRALVVYRGDIHESRLDAINAFTDLHCPTPVYVFSDMDPYGLHIAISTRNAVGFFAPDIDYLESLFTGHFSKKELFRNHQAYISNTLNEVKSQSILEYWNLMKKHEGSQSQEFLVQAPNIHLVMI